MTPLRRAGEAALRPLRRAARWLADEIVHLVAIRPARELAYEQSRNLKRGLERRALEETLDYIESHMLHVPILPSRWAVLADALERARPLEGLVLEFGVAGGDSIDYIAARTERRVYGFDSFEGLPEDWGAEHPRGSFRQSGLPAVRDNVTLVPGRFEDTLPGFLEEHPHENVALLHVDCDLYSSTACVLTALGERITAGTLVLLDEYFNFPGWRAHEHRAWQEFCQRRGLTYEYLSYAERGRQVLLSVLPDDPETSPTS